MTEEGCGLWSVCLCVVEPGVGLWGTPLFLPDCLTLLTTTAHRLNSHADTSS